MDQEITCKNCGAVYLVGNEKINKRPKDYLECLTCGERLIRKPEPKTLYYIREKLSDGVL